ncbi:MAG: glycosyltransferase family 2 protein [Actinomycetota bacterium]|nr:glycosyltransferase family 2 protein [Actinomycetota bacterium]
MGAGTTLCFVGASASNYFMNELLSAVAHAVRAEGVEAAVVMDAFSPREDVNVRAEGSTVYVVIPHEYFLLAPPAGHPTRAQLARTISFCVEQPGTRWFEISCRHAARTAAVMDIQRSSLAAMRRRGLRAEHFRLGYTDYWDRWGGDEDVERPVDVVYMGSVAERRDRLLASYADTLSPREVRLLVPPLAPKAQRRPDYLLEEEKWHCLRSAKTILNLHRQKRAYFEWARVLESVANGCVVVSEHSADASPLIAGEHYLSGSPENLALLASGLLEDSERLAAIRLGAYEFVRSELSMRPSAQRLIALAEQVRAAAARPSRRLLSLLTASCAHAPAQAGTALGRVEARLRDRVRRDPWMLAALARSEFTQELAIKQIIATKRLALADLETKRALSAQQLVARGEDPGEVRTIAHTPAYERAAVRVSVISPVYNHGAEVPRALRSVLAADCPELEVLVLDDGSSDGSAHSVMRFFESHPFLAGLLLAHPVNRGIGAARNALLQRARGELVFALDADNEIYPSTLRRLVRALDQDPGASFAYSMLQEVRDGVPTRLRSALPWEPERFREANYIDAMALMRRRELVELGGYEEDLRLHGWEDYDLWCRYAEHGRRGAFVPQILGRYHCSEYSTITLTNLDDAEMRWLLGRRYPRLMDGRPPGRFAPSAAVER